MKTLTLIVPCYNEEKRLSISAFLESTSEYPYLSFLFVDDGSVDKTGETLSHLRNLSPAFEALILPENLGKAGAVRAGVKYLLENGSSDLIGYWDADLATPLGEVPRFVSPFENDEKLEMVIGSRWPHLGASVIRKRWRDFSSLVMKLLIRLVLRLPIYDTQCGAKVMTRKTAAEVFDKDFVSPWLFDVELFRRLGRRRVLNGVKELPLDFWRDVEGSKLTTLSSLLSIIDLFKIAFS